MTTAVTSTMTCEVCRDATAVVVVADADLSERAVCGHCWHRLDRQMVVHVVRFAPPQGRRHAP